VRQAIFNVLGQSMEGYQVLDLFAGTGALGLEALSRGAERAVMVDHDPEAVRLCKANAAALGFNSQVEVLALPAERALRQLARQGHGFDLIFADPPYAARALSQTLSALPASIFRPGARLCVEHDKRELVPEREGSLIRSTEKRFGDTVFTIYSFLDPDR
jgi:16S rRNA (guanine(966)-N(2))-methyltransferase RsmD